MPFELDLISIQWASILETETLVDSFVKKRASGLNWANFIRKNRYCKYTLSDFL